MKLKLSLFICILFLIPIAINSCKKEKITVIEESKKPGIIDGADKETNQPNDDSHVLLGNPSNATNNIVNAKNYLMDKGYFTLSYNHIEGKANWVSWHLQSEDIGTAARQDDFRTDSTLPSNWYWVKNTSYSGSGFDRGHYCPSADRTSSTEANSATFVMTNMMPQAPYNNQNTWANLESECRKIVAAGNEAYIIAGSYGSGGVGSKGGITYTIDNGNVVVPSNTWKIVLILPKGNNDINRISATTRVIAVNIANSNNVQSNWKNYRTSVRAIENATGYNFFSNLATTLQDAIETKIDNQ